MRRGGAWVVSCLVSGVLLTGLALGLETSVGGVRLDGAYALWVWPSRIAPLPCACVLGFVMSKVYEGSYGERFVREFVNGQSSLREVDCWP